MKPLATLEPPHVEDRRHGHQGGDRELQGAHRRHRRPRDGRGRRDDDCAGAGRRSHPQVRRRLGRRAASQPRPTLPARRWGDAIDATTSCWSASWAREDHGRAPPGSRALGATSSTPTTRWPRSPIARSPRSSPPMGQGHVSTIRPTSSRSSSAPPPTVIASGGQVVLGTDNRRRLREPEVTVVWLDAAPTPRQSGQAARAPAPPCR